MAAVRTMFASALAMLLIAGAAGPALAASHQAKGQEKKADKPSAAARRHVGTVKAVDPAAGMLTVAEKEGGDAQVSVTDKTTIKKGKETAKLGDLKSGDAVSVVYVKEGGNDVARSITITSK